MSTADAFSPEMAAAYAKRMVERESRGNDQIGAFERVGRKCGLNARSLRRLINGEMKDPGIALFGKIRAAYLDLCARQIKELQVELDRERTRFGDEPFVDLAAEAEALAAKIEAARKGRITR